jgi:MerR family transcriptional regulator, copper efflux regulator
LAFSVERYCTDDSASQKDSVRVAQANLADVNERIAALERVRDRLATLIEACPGHGRAADCPILQTLGGDERD